MLRVNNLIGFGGRKTGPIGAPTLDGTDALADSGDGTTTNTFNSKTSTGPHTFMCVTATDIITGVTWNGAAGSILVNLDDGTRGVAIVYWAGAQSGNVVVSTTGTANVGLTWISVDGNLQSATAVDTDSEAGTAGGADLDSLATPGVGGIRICGFINQTNSTAVTWANATEVSDFSVTGHRHSMAYDLGDDATAIEANGASGAGNDEIIVGVSMR